MSDDTFLDGIRASLTVGVSVLVFITVLVGGGYYLYRWAAPRYEEAQRQTYEQSRQHVEGTVEDLMRYRVKYQEADSTQKGAIRDLILRRARDIDRTDMPEELRQWIGQLRDQTKP